MLLSALQELLKLRIIVARLRQEAEQSPQDNERLQRELDQARRQSKRQAAPLSKGLEYPSPNAPDATSAIIPPFPRPVAISTTCPPHYDPGLRG
jgi:hypothetical protein